MSSSRLPDRGKRGSTRPRVLKPIYERAAIRLVMNASSADVPLPSHLGSTSICACRRRFEMGLLAAGGFGQLPFCREQIHPGLALLAGRAQQEGRVEGGE